MIASIEGRISAIEDQAIVIQVGGLGFRVHVPEPVLSKIGPIGGSVSLHTYLHVREDNLALYGCATKEDLQLFELLLGVSGIGPKVALAMLSNLSAQEIKSAIATGQDNVLSSVPGIGAKTAQKVILDLKDKIQVPADLGLPVPHITEIDEEVIAALTTLGYSVIEAQTALQHIPTDATDLEERLRAALAYLGG
jgi:Holliday junction DNA helicase RuvA